MKIISLEKRGQTNVPDPYAAINQKIAAMVDVYARNYAEVLSASEGGRANKVYNEMKRLESEIAEDLYQIRRRNEN